MMLNPKPFRSSWTTLGEVEPGAFVGWDGLCGVKTPLDQICLVPGMAKAVEPDTKVKRVGYLDLLQRIVQLEDELVEIEATMP